MQDMSFQEFMDEFFMSIDTGSEESLKIREDYFAEKESKTSKIETQKEISIPQRMEETDKRYVFVYELPGIEKEKTDIEVIDNKLIISFEKNNVPIQTSKVYFDTTVNGKFKLSAELPENIDINNIEAKYDNGILKIIIPKTSSIKREKIIIK